MPLADVFIGEMRISRAQAIALAAEHVRDQESELSRQALGAVRTATGWTVVFRRRPRRSNWGRAVSMDWFGKKIRLVPRDLDLTLPGSWR